MADGDLPYIQLRTERRMDALKQQYERRVTTLREEFDENLAALQSTTPPSPPCQPPSSAALSSNAGETTRPELAPEDGVDAEDGVRIPVLEELPSRRRLRFKQAPPDQPSAENPDVCQPAVCLPHNWTRVSGVSHASQTNADYGPRRSFQVSVAKAGVDKTKLYFKYSIITSPGTAPCNSTACWQKTSGRNLVFCGKDVCAYDAAVTCHAEPIAALPDKRRRLAEADSDDQAAAPQGDLDSWKTRWL